MRALRGVAYRDSGGGGGGVQMMGEFGALDAGSKSPSGGRCMVGGSGESGLEVARRQNLTTVLHTMNLCHLKTVSVSCIPRLITRKVLRKLLTALQASCPVHAIYDYMTLKIANLE